MALKPGHDGTVAVIEDRRLVLSIEAEKDTHRRYSGLTAETLLTAAEHTGGAPDVVALGGWDRDRGSRDIGAGYHGAERVQRRPSSFFGHPVEYFSSTHERSHIMMAVGMAPREQVPLQTVLVWEGITGAFVLLDDKFQVVRKVDVMHGPGTRYAFLYGLAEPTVGDRGLAAHPEFSGKLMALASFARPEDAGPEITALVDRILALDEFHPGPSKAEFRDSPLYNAGVQSPECKAAAALLTRRIFERFHRAAVDALPAGTPLRVSGGCGLNCEWNSWWRESEHFSSYFVPPCTNDSGSAIGTAIDALAARTGDPYIDWDVYAGLDFEWDEEPDTGYWTERPRDDRKIAAALHEGRVAAWVQGRWEIGPRALGNRSLLAEPFDPGTKDKLNEVKQRESYRPIAPCCRVEDLSEVFVEGYVDPYMLYFQRMKSEQFGAVTHVDGSARAQSVSAQSNPQLHRLLTAFAERAGVGVLCNTSLNYKGQGFINRMSDLHRYCRDNGVDDMVVGDRWFTAPGRS